MYSVEDIINIGAKESVKQQAKFSEVEIYCSEDGRSFEPEFIDLYGMFTIETQHTYGTEDELLFMLGADKIIKEKHIETSFPTAEIYKQGMEDTIAYIKRIGRLKGVEVNSNDYHDLHTELEKTGKFNIGNYFCWYRNGRYDYLNAARLLKENKLMQ